ncbi:hypothetical protein C0J26_13120 [Pseudomonas baetica]|nr:hypothetical protein C0J26_13120 [Pseudomonas baetica]
MTADQPTNPQLTTPNPIVGVSLLAMTTSQPTNPQLTTPNPYGAGSDDGLTANQYLPVVLNPVGSLAPAMTACQPTNIYRLYSIPVGAGLPAMTACQPTNIYRLYSIPVGAWLASDDGLPATQALAGILDPIVGASLLAKATCQPTNF